MERAVSNWGIPIALTQPPGPHQSFPSQPQAISSPEDFYFHLFDLAFFIIVLFHLLNLAFALLVLTVHLLALAATGLSIVSSSDSFFFSPEP